MIRTKLHKSNVAIWQKRHRSYYLLILKTRISFLYNQICKYSRVLHKPDITILAISREVKQMVESRFHLTNTFIPRIYIFATHLIEKLRRTKKKLYKTSKIDVI